MNKFIAFATALAALSCTLTACGSTDDTSSSEKAASSTTVSSTADSSAAEIESGSDNAADTSEEESTDASMAYSTEPEENFTGHPADEDAPYMDDLKKMVDCINNGDYVRYIKYMYPDGIIDAALKEQGKTIDSLSEEMAKMMTTGDGKEMIPFKLGRVYEYDEDYELLSEMHEALDKIRNSPSDVEKAASEYGFDISAYLGYFENCRIIDVELISGSGKSDIETFMAYEVDGEGWKFDVTFLSMARYIKKSKQMSANTAANSLSKAAMSTLTDIDVKAPNGIPSGKFVIGSDNTMDTNVPDGLDAEEVRNGIKQYFDKAEELNYFIIVENVNVTKVVCVQKDNSENVGIFPIDNDNTETFEELLKKAKAGGLYEEYKETVSERMKQAE